MVYVNAPCQVLFVVLVVNSNRISIASLRLKCRFPLRVGLMCFIDAWISNESTKCIWALPFNGKSAIYHFEGSNAIEIRSRTIFDFYTGLPQIHYVSLVYEYFFSLSVLSSPDVEILPVVLVPTVLVVMIIALLCGLICVVYQLKKEVKYVTVHSIATYHNIP